jgi:hypothetical protein
MAGGRRRAVRGSAVTRWAVTAAGFAVLWLLLGRGWAVAMLVAVAAFVWVSRTDTRVERRRRRWTQVERQIVLYRDGYRCRWCGSPYDLELDHIVPFSKGGACDLSNLQTLCSDCNKRKGAKEFM